MQMMCRAFMVCLAAFVGVFDAAAQSSNAVLQLRFMDSQTGYALQPEVAVKGSDHTEPMLLPVGKNGRVRVELPPGDYTLSIVSQNHQTMTSAIAVNETTPPLQFSLDPLTKPENLRPENIFPLHRSDSTVFLGYVVSDDDGQPLQGVRVFSLPANVSTLTDADGFFVLHVPLQSSEEFKEFPANLVFEKAGHVSEEHRNLELWSNGDWIFRVQLSSGEGRNIVDQEGKRIEPAASPALPDTDSQVGKVPVAYATSPTNATIRIPTNIRVLMTNGTIEYVSMETYTARSVSHEWYSSWGNYSGGMNSLKAGTVAVRSYAAWYVNNATNNSNYDICATTSCQVYKTTSTANGDSAAAQTAGYVVIGSNNMIARSEYSAENNSLGFSCGDGFTQPTGGCIADPVCSGETRYGHGRGMCQWGTFKWATGLKVAGNGGSYPSNANSGITNGYPKQDWIWIVNHYYPDLTLVQAKPLVIGDDIRITGSTARDVRMCADGTISSGINCPLVTTMAAGSTGVITAGPVRVTSDSKGFTWWKVTWSDNQVGWIPENWLERVIPVPSAPTNLRAVANSATEALLTWNVDTSTKLGYRIERRLNTTESWMQINDIAFGVTNYLDSTVQPATTNYYRIRAYNLGGNSPYSNTTNAITPGIPPTLAAIANRTIVEGTTLTFTNVASAPDFVTRLTDFENYSNGAAVIFRAPNFSGSTSAHIDTGSSTAVTTSFPTNATTGGRVLKTSWSFKTGTSNPWLRLTTAGTANLPNPVIDFTKKLTFDIYTDKSLKIALGCRETTTASGTAIGSDGGTTGAIEFVGVNAGTQPNPTRTIPANVWTNISFNLPLEPAASFSSGNGVLSTASGLGVLEQLAIVPNGELGAYNVYLDNFSVAQPKVLTFSLDAGAPAGAAIHPNTGVFTWTPTEAQGPGTYSITVRVTDNAAIPQSATRTFSVTVLETNSAPVLAAIANRTVHVGNNVVFTNSAADADIPANALSFSLDPGAPTGSSVNPTTGVFSWTPGDAFSGSNNSITVRVTDNGVPALSDAKTFIVSVVAKPSFSGITVNGSNLNLSWSAISGRSYKIQYKNSLSDVAWTDLVTIVAAGGTVSRNEPLGTGQRYYRVIALD
ncbi:MAG: putative Ig domain-containing protein [Limisphaerales bacterium]